MVRSELQGFQLKRDGSIVAIIGRQELLLSRIYTSLVAYRCNSASSCYVSIKIYSFY